MRLPMGSMIEQSSTPATKYMLGILVARPLRFQGVLSLWEGMLRESPTHRGSLPHIEDSASSLTHT